MVPYAYIILRKSSPVSSAPSQLPNDTKHGLNSTSSSYSIRRQRSQPSSRILHSRKTSPASSFTPDPLRQRSPAVPFTANPPASHLPRAAIPHPHIPIRKFTSSESPIFSLHSQKSAGTPYLSALHVPNASSAISLPISYLNPAVQPPEPSTQRFAIMSHTSRHFGSLSILSIHSAHNCPDITINEM